MLPIAQTANDATKKAPITQSLSTLDNAVGDGAKVRLALGELNRLVNLTHHSYIDKGNLAGAVCNLNLKAATIGHHLANEGGLASELARVDSYFVVEEKLCLCDFNFVFHILHASSIPHRVGHL